jgi:hypothetical protein
MAAFTSTPTSSYLKELMEAAHNWTSHSFKVALYYGASLDQDTTVYSATNEISGSGYTTGGAALTVLTNPTAVSGGAYMDFTDLTWSTGSFTTDQALIYNTSNSNTSCFVITFASDRTVSAADFTLTWPTAGVGSSVGRLVRGTT